MTCLDVTSQWKEGEELGSSGEMVLYSGLSGEVTGCYWMKLVAAIMFEVFDVQ